MTITDEELMKMNLDELKDNLNKSTEVYQKEYGNLKKHITDTLEGYIRELGMKDYAEVDYVSDHSAEIRVGKTKDCDGYSVDLSYYKRFDNDRRLCMNYWSFGAFDITQKSKVEYMVALGKVAENLASIEHDIFDYDWDNYYSVMHKMQSDDALVSRYEGIIEKKEKAVKEREFINKMKEGTEIIVGVKKGWDNGKVFKYDHIKHIEKITDKNIVFTEDYGHRTKKSYALSLLVSGCWKIKEKDTDTLVTED